METVALGVALSFSFVLALSLQWGLLAVIVRHMTRRPVAATSAPRAAASSAVTGAASRDSSSA